MQVVIPPTKSIWASKVIIVSSFLVETQQRSLECVLLISRQLVCIRSLELLTRLGGDLPGEVVGSTSCKGRAAGV